MKLQHVIGKTGPDQLINTLQTAAPTHPQKQDQQNRVHITVTGPGSTHPAGPWHEFSGVWPGLYVQPFFLLHQAGEMKSRKVGFEEAAFSP